MKEFILLLREQSHPYVIEMIDRSTLEEKIQTERSNQDFFKRLKYVGDDHEEFYIIALNKRKIIGVTTLKMSPFASQPSTVWVMGVSTDEKYRNQGIAAMMIEETFSYADKNDLTVLLSSYTQDGEMYLPAVISRVSQKYPSVLVKKSDDY